MSVLLMKPFGLSLREITRASFRVNPATFKTVSFLIGRSFLNATGDKGASLALALC